jgi:hypothetical protein
MMHIHWTRWRRDLLVGVLASVLTIALMVPFGWAAVRDHREQAEAARHMAQAAALLAEQKASEADRQRAQAQRNLVAEAVDFAGLTEGADTEVLRVTSRAVTPELPENSWLLIDKKAATYAVGDIVIYRVDDRTYLGRVVAVDQAAGQLTVGRNGEANRQLAFRDVVGRGAMNTR